MYQTNFPCFFASANTANGFENKFSDIFNPEMFDKIFIIKGGPGTGKSSLMKSIEKLAMENNIEVEDFLCSSDPNSLDGIILKNKKIAILDGTSPHIFEPSFPGAVENIINTGSFWNVETLTGNRTPIITLIKEKKRYYKRAYRFLKAYGETENEISKLYEKNILKGKLEKNAKRTIEKLMLQNGSGAEEVRLDETISFQGVIKLNTFEQLSKKIYLLYQNEYVALEYMSVIYNELIKKKCDLILGFSHKFPSKICSIYLPNQHIAFVIRDKKPTEILPNKDYHFLNMKRFYNAETVQYDREKIHFGKRCSQMLLSGAAESLHEAKKIHSELESIYISSMDFEKFNEERNRLIAMIFSEMRE